MLAHASLKVDTSLYHNQAIVHFLHTGTESINLENGEFPKFGIRLSEQQSTISLAFSGYCFPTQIRFRFADTSAKV